MTKKLVSDGLTVSATELASESRLLASLLVRLEAMATLLGVVVGLPTSVMLFVVLPHEKKRVTESIAKKWENNFFIQGSWSVGKAED